MSDDDMDNVFKEIEELEKAIQVNGNVIDIHPGNYDIALSSCDSHEKILGWVVHLNRKIWMTPNLMNKFIEVACNANGLNIPRP